MKISYLKAKKIYDMFKHRAKPTSNFTHDLLNNTIFIKDNIALMTDGYTAEIIEFKEKFEIENKLKMGCDFINALSLKVWLRQKKKNEFYIFEYYDNIDISKNRIDLVENLIKELDTNILFTTSIVEFFQVVKRLETLRQNPPSNNAIFLKLIINPDNKKEIEISSSDNRGHGTGDIDTGSELLDINMKIYKYDKGEFISEYNLDYFYNFLKVCMGRYIAVKIQSQKEAILLIDDVADDMTEMDLVAHYSLIMPVTVKI